MSKKLTYTLVLAAAVAGSAGITSMLTTQIFAQPSTSVATTTTVDNSSTTLADQTVYVFMKPDGSVRKIMNSDWLKGANGEDLYQKSASTENTPISIKVSYTLDGKDISAADLAGKSGKVTIRFDYTNNEKSGNYYVPYTVLTGLMLDNDHFKNVTAENAKVLNDGSRTIIAGVALPGMQENLGLSSSEFEIPDTLEITADTTNFKLDMTMSLVTSKLFANLDTSKLDSLDQISSQLGELEDGMNKLMNGSSELYNGLSELNSKSGALVSGIKQLSDGSAELKSGTAALDAGLAQLQTTVKDTLIDGVNAIVGENYRNSTTITNGVAEVIDTVAMPAALAQTNASISSLLDLFTDINAAAGTDLPTDRLTAENYTTELTTWIGAMDDSTVAGALASHGQDAATTKTSLTELYTGLAKLDALKVGTENYTAGVNQLAAGLNTTLPAGITELKTGSEQLTAGASALADGLATLDSSTPALVDGIGKLKDGSNALKDGLTTFNNEGVSRLINFYNGNLSGLSTRLKTIVNLSKSSKQNVKYIYRTDEIK